MVHVEYDKLKFFYIRHHVNVYTRVDKNCVDYSGTIIPYEG